MAQQRWQVGFHASIHGKKKRFSYFQSLYRPKASSGFKEAEPNIT
jgi:hypothetical protein